MAKEEVEVGVDLVVTDLVMVERVETVEMKVEATD